MEKEKLEDIAGMYRGLTIKAHQKLLKFLITGLALNFMSQFIHNSIVSPIVFLISVALFTYAILSLVTDSFLMYNPEWVDKKPFVPVPKKQHWLTKHKVLYHFSLVACGATWLFGILLAFGIIGKQETSLQNLSELYFERGCYGVAMVYIGMLWPMLVKVHIKFQHEKERNHAEKLGKLVVIDFGDK